MSKFRKELKAENGNLWVENSCVGKNWTLHSRNIITGVPENNWSLNLPEGVCVDVEPIGDFAYVARPYGMNDAFKGALSDEKVTYLERPVMQWLFERGLQPSYIEGNTDLQSARLFPVCEHIEDLGLVLDWMINHPDNVVGK